MSKQIGYGLMAIALTLALVVIPGQAQGTPALPEGLTSVGSFYWYTDLLDETDDRGTHTAIAFDIYNSTAWISYYDESYDNLMVAHQVSSGGNCGPNNGWKCETVDEIGNVGLYNAIDVYPDPTPGGTNGRRVGVSYYDATNHALKFAEYLCLPICYWYLTTIESGTTSPSVPAYGLYTSIKYDISGTPHIAYYYSNPSGDDALRYAYRVSSGGNCGVGSAVGKWQCVSVDTGILLGQYTSLELAYAGTLVKPYIAYYDGGAGDLRLAQYEGMGGGGGCTHPYWYCLTIDGTDADVGKFASLRLSSVLRLAYYDATNNKVKFASSVAGGTGNCGGTAFRCFAIEETNLSTRGLSLAVDGDGQPLVAYRYVSEGFSQLRVAQPIEALGLSKGNCGPLGMDLNYTWQCQSVDTAGITLHSYAEYVAAAFDPQGIPAIAYSVNLFNLTGGDYNLRLARRGMTVFLPLVRK